MALALLFPTTSLAGEVSSPSRLAVPGDRVRISGRHNSVAFTTGEGRVVPVNGDEVLLQATLISGATVASNVSVFGLTVAGATVPGCVASVSGPLPKDPARAACTPNVARYRTVVRFSEI